MSLFSLTMFNFEVNVTAQDLYGNIVLIFLLEHYVKHCHQSEYALADVSAPSYFQLTTKKGDLISFHDC